MPWTDTDAQANFDELLDKVESEGPQLIRRGDSEYWMMTLDQWDAQVPNSQAESKPFVSAWDALGPSSGATFDFEIPRMRGKMRTFKF